MNRMATRSTVFSKGLCMALMLISAFAVPAMAQSKKSWTTAGSAGTVDNDSLDIVSLSGGGVAALSNTAPPAATGHIRYNVVAVDGLFGVGFPKMTVRYQDNGPNAQVRLLLMRYPIAGGVPEVMIEFDSNDHAAAPQLQTRSTNPCDANFTFDFSRYIYWIEAQLERTDETGFPLLVAIQLSSVGANCVP
ncbi:MAG TPA: hypothetical protein VNO70_05195 [Blastocatellia bacterium]|nr:hypothetical protein [Blastocatellia bacterium]